MKLGMQISVISVTYETRKHYVNHFDTRKIKPLKRHDGVSSQKQQRRGKDYIFTHDYINFLILSKMF